MADFITEMRDRRVLPAVGVYIGGCWVLIEILDRLVERYLLSPHLTDIAFWGLYSLIPAVILVAWTHGKPGKDQITRAEKVGLPINIIATIGLLLTLFSDKDLGAAAELVTISDEHGQTVSQYVAGQAHRRKMVLFFWENQTRDAENDWLSYAVPQMVTQDLQQSPFVQATSIWSGGPNGMYLMLKQAGFDDGLGVPTSLMRRIADDTNRDYYIEGNIAKAGEDWVLTARVRESQNASIVGSVEERGVDLYQVADQISLGVREILDVPTGGAVEDLSLVDTYGESSEALQTFIGGMNAWLFENDLQKAQEEFDRTLGIDAQFVLAWFYKARLAVEQGDLGRAQLAYSEAQKLDYRLSALDRMIVKASLFRIAGDNEKLISFLRMHHRLGDNVRSRVILANVLLNTGELDEAKALYREAYELDPSEIGLLLAIAGIERASQNEDKAIEAIETFLARKPDDVNANLIKGDIFREAGDNESALAAYEQALFVSSGNNIEPMVRLSQLASSRGDIDEAFELLDTATQESTEPSQLSIIANARNYHYQRTGEIRKALEMLDQKVSHDMQFLPPVSIALSQTPERVQLNLYIGAIDAARDALAMGMNAMEPPMNEFLAFNEAMILVEEQRFEEARQAVERGVRVIEQFQMKAFNFLISLSRANIARQAGDHAAAARHYEASLEELSNAIIGGLPELMTFRPDIVGLMAMEQIQAGDLEAARGSIEMGFKLDMSNPLLWMARAHLQLVTGEYDLAQASLAYTHAIWKNADEDYVFLNEAIELGNRIQASRQAGQ